MEGDFKLDQCLIQSQLNTVIGPENTPTLAGPYRLPGDWN